LHNASPSFIVGVVKKTSLAEMPCPIARTLDVIGEWWTLLIVRDAFLGARRYEEFRSTGIADNILSARLKRLVDDEILERRPYQSHPERFEYLLTAKGRALLPVIASIASWGQKWTKGSVADRTPRLSHVECGHELSLGSFGMTCAGCGRAVSVDEVQVARRSPLMVALPAESR
jgi:DNA-binding HxlR family transcriptional regulator